MIPSVCFFHPNQVEDSKLLFAVIAAKYNGRWIFCRHKKRRTWEIPGGKREPEEKIHITARRELYEETGAIRATLSPLSVYSAEIKGKTSFGMLFYAEINTLSELPEESEIAEISFFETLPENLTYPEIQPYLYQYTQNWLKSQ